MLNLLVALVVPCLIACEAWVMRVFLADSRRAYRLACWTLVAIAGVALAMLLWVGCSHQWYAAWDSSFVLDGAWRMYHGQRPHTDFYTHIGAVPFLITCLAMEVMGPTVKAWPYGYVVLFPLLTLWAWALAKPRLPAFHALVFAALTGFLVVATRPLSQSYRTTSYAMVYNRLGWSLFALLLLHVCLPRRTPASRRTAQCEGASTGAVLALLLFLKVTYFAAGVLTLAAGLILLRETRRAWPGMAAAFVAIALAFLIYLRFDVPAYVQDLRMAAGVTGLGNRLWDLWIVTVRNRWAIALFLSAMALLAGSPRPQRAIDGELSWRRALPAAALAAFLGVMICAGNAADKEIPTLAIGAVILWEVFRRRSLASPVESGRAPQARLRALLGGIVACYLAGATLAPDMASVAYVFAWKLVKAPQAPRGARIHSESLRDMILPPTQNERDLEPDRVVEGIRQSDPNRSGFTSYRYAQWMNDGIDLLRRHVTPRSRVWTLEWYNPFPFALRLPPPQRGALCLCHGFTVDEQHHPPPEVLLGDATLVMVPRHSASERSLAFLKRTYRSALEKDFVPLDSSRLWTLYRRRSSPSDAAPPH